MLILISPAKTLDFENKAPTTQKTQPELLTHSKSLISELKNLSVKEISSLMGISEKLSDLNYGRFQTWKTPFNLKNAKQALYAFQGDVYVGLEAEEWSKADVSFAQDHLRILSGLYGLLKPLDLIQPYRLEMGTKFKTSRGKNLYEFWGSQITEAVEKDFKSKKGNILINLASNEYYKSIKEKELKCEVVTPVFKDFKSGQYKVISFLAKKARGRMAAYVIQNRLKSVDELKNFDLDGYSFNAKLSKGKELVFTRK